LPLVPVRPLSLVMSLVFTAAFISPAVLAAPIQLKPQAVDASGSLTSHRAVYNLTLTKVSQSDGVRAASGTMTYTLTDRCDGYTIETNMLMSLAFANGADNDIDQRYAAWESKDGKFSTFRMQVLENGALGKSYRGNIRFNDDGTGTATYQADEETKFELVPGTLLSTAHSLALLKSAVAGDRFLSKLVIDGSFDDGPFRVTAAIAPAHEGAVPAAKSGPGELSQGSYWPVGLAYFPVSSSKEVPDYEVAMNMLPSGVTQSMAQDFGGFTLGFKLVRIEPITKPPC